MSAFVLKTGGLVSTAGAVRPSMRLSAIIDRFVYVL
jgi:hypothetical protein